MNQKNNLFLSIILFISLLPCQAIEWVNPTNVMTSYLFAPGIHSSERHIAKYCDGYEASTGQLVYTDNDFIVIGDTVHAINFPEIILDQIHVESLKKEDFVKPKSMLGHLYNNIVKKRNRSNDRHERITIEKKENPGPNIEAPAVRLSDINLAQEGDVLVLSQAYDEHCVSLPNTNIVLYGVSRGAATVFNFMATEYFTKNIKNIKVVILEACFDSMNNVLHHKYSLVQNYPQLQALVKKFFSFIYPGHDLDGIEPIKVVDNFPKDIPVLLITSKKDTVVPCQTTWNLYHALKDSGHPHVYILELKHSAHPRYMMDDAYDKKFYESVVHAFYKKFNLPYNPQLIEFGEAILKECQPD